VNSRVICGRTRSRLCAKKKAIWPSAIALSIQIIPAKPAPNYETGDHQAQKKYFSTIQIVKHVLIDEIK
jgi:hypothetical protein